MNQKQIAGEKAVSWIKDDMIVGLGTGSTAYYAIKKIGELVQNGLKIKAIPTSKETERLALESNIELVSLSDVDHIDLTIDGADKIDENLNLIKGGGGALFREKIIALNSETLIIIADESKLSKKLEGFLLPIEVVPFGYQTLIKPLKELGLQPKLRIKDETPFITDNGNYILDCNYDNELNLVSLENKLKSFTGVVETGLFVGMADLVIIGYDNKIEILEK